MRFGFVMVDVFKPSVYQLMAEMKKFSNLKLLKFVYNKPELVAGQSDDPHVESVPARAGPCWLGGRQVVALDPAVLAAPFPLPPLP